MKILPFSQTVLLATLFGASPAALAGPEDWLCDLTINSNPPPGCSRWGDNLQGGLCTSLEATVPWHCITGWAPGNLGGGGIGYNQEKSARANTLVRSEYALTQSNRTQRSARVQLNTDAVPSQAVVLELRPQHATQDAIVVHSVRGADGQVELHVTAITQQGAKANKLLARLPLRQGRVTAIAHWRMDPVDGPRLSLASGTSEVEVSLQGLDAHTRLDIYEGAASKLWFDIDAAPAPRRAGDPDSR